MGRIRHIFSPNPKARIISCSHYSPSPSPCLIPQPQPQSGSKPESLQSHLLRLSPLHSHPHRSLQFFRWSLQHRHYYPSRTKNQEHYDYDHTLQSYVSLIRALSSLPSSHKIHSDDDAWPGCIIKQLVCEMTSLSLSLTLYASTELMKSLAIVGLVEELLWVWRQMKFAGLEPSLVHYNCLMECLVNSGFVDSAEKVFYSMNEKPDVTSYNILIKGYCNSGQAAKAVELFMGLCKDGKPFEGLKVFEEMLKKGYQPNVPIYNALIDSFGKCGREDQAISLFERMKINGFIPDGVTYGVVINCLCNSGKLVDAMQYFRFCEKEGGVMVNVAMYTDLINAFGKAGIVEQAQQLFDEMPDNGLVPDSLCYNTLIDALVKAGRIDYALAHAKRMESDGFNPTVSTYTVLIHGLFTKHRNEEAIKLWYEMVNEKGIIPTNTAFRVLSRGLCLSGKFNIACKVLDEIAPMGVVVENAHEEMLNVLCKAGRFKQACTLADEIVGKEREIPGRVRTAMINALRKVGNADLAIKLMHSKIGIGYDRFGSIKRRVKFQTLFD